MAGHFVKHDFVGRTGINGVVGEHGLEVGFGHAGPADEVLAGIDGEVCEEFFEGFEPVVIMTMSRFGEPDDVLHSIVRRDTIEVVTFEVRVVMGTMPSGGDEEVNEVGVLWRSNDFVGLFTAIVDTAGRGFEEALREFSVDSDEGKNEIDVFAVFGRVKRFGRVTVLNDGTVG